MPKIPMTISLPKDLYHAIDRLAELQHSSKSSLIISFLEPSLPTLTSMADLIEHLQNATPEQRAVLQSKILTTGQEAENALIEINQAISPKE